MKKVYSLLMSLFVFLAVSASFADDVFSPPWRGNDHSQYAVWSEWNGTYNQAEWWEIYPLISVEDWIKARPSFGGDGYTLDEGVIHLTQDDGIWFYLDNYDPEQPEKWVRVQITYYADFGDYDYLPSLRGFNVTDGYGQAEPPEFGDDDLITPTLFDSSDMNDGWITAAYDFKIIPNVPEEWIGLKFDDYGFTGPAVMSNGNGYAPGVYIDQVVIDTICTPIPSAVCLLGAGMVGLVGLRRKFKN